MNKKQINIAIFGFGTVGTGVYKTLLTNGELIAKRIGRNIVVKNIVDLDITRDRGVQVPPGVLTTDAAAVLSDPDIAIVVEVIGGVNPAKKFIEQALTSGKHVVTSNKEIIAKHGREFLQLARQHNVNIYFEASAGGGIPIISILNKALAANAIKRIFGIVNGTTNYILTKMYQENAEFATVLAEAQQLGYAEADPTNDVDGHDVAYKLSILAGLAFNAHFDYKDIYTEGIRNISAQDIALAREFGYVIKLLAIGIAHDDTRVELRVHPVMIKNDHPLAAVNDAFNAVFVEGDCVGETMFYGRGAGSMPTASAVVGDVIDIALTFDLKETNAALNFDFAERKLIPIGDVLSKYFIRLTVQDKPGVLAQISTICGKHNVSLKSVQQKESTGVETELVLITHTVKESSMQQTIREFNELDAVIAVNSLIRAGL
jgi:homoserine dehydrogenase